MAASEKIRALKLLIGGLEQPVARESYPCSTLSLGIPKGAIVELLGPQKTEWLCHFLAENSQTNIFWVEKEQSVLPTALQQRGVDLSRVTFGLFGDDPTIKLRRVVQSQLYPIIVAPNEFSEIRIFKAFQLLTEKSNSVLFLLGKKEPCLAWPITMQLEIHKRGNDFKIEVIKNKGGSLS